jgi:hypothetical protein
MREQTPFEPTNPDFSPEDAAISGWVENATLYMELPIEDVEPLEREWPFSGFAVPT